MNLSDCKTIEEYREAAHYWQKKWLLTDDLLVEVGLVVAGFDPNHKVLNKIALLKTKSILEKKNRQ